MTGSVQMVGDHARLRSQLRAFCQGSGIAVRARRRFDLLSSLDVQFSDDLGLADLRRNNPRWAVDPLAPVAIVQDSWGLSECADASSDFAVAMDFLAQPDRLTDGFAASARVLVPGGRLVIVQPVSDAVVEADVTDGATTLEGIADAIFAHRADYVGEFEFQTLLLDGDEAAFFFERRWPSLSERDLVSYGGAVYVVNEGLLRHVTSIEVLRLIEMADRQIVELNPRRFARYGLGKSLFESDARDLLARWEQTG